MSESGLVYEMKCLGCGSILTADRGTPGRHECSCGNHAYLEVSKESSSGNAVDPDKLRFRRTPTDKWVDYTQFFGNTGRILRTDTTKSPYQDPPEFSAVRIKTLRTSLNLPQPSFASLTGASLGTVQAWEQGKASPSGCAARLLQLLEIQGDTFKASIPRKQQEIDG